MAAHDPEKRREVAASGARARNATADPVEAFAARGAGGKAANSPASLARRIVKKWPEMTRAERAEVRAILAEIVPRTR